MIKVEVLEEEGNRIIFFESNKQEDVDTLDKILEALAGPYPRQGGFIVGPGTNVLQIRVKVE